MSDETERGEATDMGEIRWSVRVDGTPSVVTEGVEIAGRLTPVDARKLGAELMSAAETAETLASVYTWLKQNSTLSPDEVSRLVMSLSATKGERDALDALVRMFGGR